MRFFIYTIPVCFFLFGTQLSAQQREVEMALKTGKTSRGYYEVSRYYKVQKFMQWREAHKNDYAIVDFTAFETVEYECVVREVTWFAFVKVDELDEYNLQKSKGTKPQNTPVE